MALKQFVERGDLRGFVLVDFDRGDGSRHVALAQRSVTDDHDLFDLGFVAFEFDVDPGACPDGDFLRFVAQITYLERLLGRGRNYDFVAAFGVAARSGRRAFHEDRGADHRFAVFVGYASADGGLGEKFDREQQSNRKTGYVFRVFHDNHLFRELKRCFDAPGGKSGRADRNRCPRRSGSGRRCSCPPWANNPNSRSGRRGFSP